MSDVACLEPDVSLRRREPIHQPSPESIEASQLTAFMRYCSFATGRRLGDPHAFHAFSVERFREFWSLFARWSGLIWEGSRERVCVGDACERATFFPDARLSYVENLLRLDGELDPARPALTSRDENGRPTRLNRGELAARVARIAGSLSTLGVKEKQRIVCIVNNDAEAVVASLAALALGASISTASPDVGAYSIVNRFSQLEPDVLFCHLRSRQPEAGADHLGKIREVVRSLPTLRTAVALDEGVLPRDLSPSWVRLRDLERGPALSGWPRFEFNHPLFILFSSGTTGRPKAIVHGAGGTLLEHLKEHRLHCDLRPRDKLFFQTSCAWMMWNWQLSALAAGAEIVLNPDPVRGADSLWRLVSDEQVTVFGTSPAYLRMCEDAGYSPRRQLPLERLRAILSTGSILPDRQYDWVRANVGELPLQSISGGTDIIGCFVLGNPNLPVYRGECQSRSLAMDVQAQGAREGGPAAGELVCRNPFPSRPLGFVGDTSGERFHQAYFNRNGGVWSHGDLIEFTREGSARLHGRMDGVLNINGVRIGPAEIGDILKGVAELKETMAVEQTLPGDARSRLVLLVLLADGVSLDDALKRRIRRELAVRGSAAHVPEIIVAVAEFPHTHSGKRSDNAVREALAGKSISNAMALRNPDSISRIVSAVEAEDERKHAPLAPAASGALESLLVSIWERVLDTRPISRDESFFDLGGTSLRVLEMLDALRDETGLDVPASLLIEAPTIAQLAMLLEERAPAFSPSSS